MHAITILQLTRDPSLSLFGNRLDNTVQRSISDVLVLEPKLEAVAVLLAVRLTCIGSAVAPQTEVIRRRNRTTDDALGSNFLQRTCVLFGSVVAVPPARIEK